VQEFAVGVITRMRDQVDLAEAGTWTSERSVFNGI
jgi:hypothetical protein